ncbi:MAG TPA: hypothetical protein PK440_18225 [Candidatus Accumulibacter phosphatis]|nr:MAG: hypothetical protein AW07_03631 [Candidatus Accumulibacter sp. SK-11]HRL78041.1 hypothetical protein [Candidatus Accumulibacter phosphatis]HRQ96909.1 hypothetical protein [Candidatus Accumulibacter phosphatis]
MPASKTPPASKSAIPVRSPPPPRAEPAGNPLRQAETRWQRSARYVWDKGGSRGGR